jgi:hypothetical protein
VVQEGIRVDRNARTEGDEEVVPSLVNPSTQTRTGVASVMHIRAGLAHSAKWASVLVIG